MLFTFACEASVTGASGTRCFLHPLTGRDNKFAELGQEAAARGSRRAVLVIARITSDDPSSLAARATRGVSPPKHPCAKAEAIQGKGRAGSLRGAGHRARVRATRWLAVTLRECAV